MSKKEVLLSICDRCHVEAETEVQKHRLGHRKDRYLLPPGWINIAANTATHTVFEMDLCEESKAIVLEAAGSARRA
jgi:hypothetical protein